MLYSESMPFGEHLSRILAAHGKSQSDVARAIGVSAAAVNQWVTQNRVPNTDHAKKAAAYLGITVAELRGEDSTEAPSMPDGPAPDAFTRRQRSMIGIRIERVLAARNPGWDVSRIAEHMGWPKEEMAAYLDGDADIEAPRLIALCVRQGVSADFVLLGDETPLERSLAQILRDPTAVLKVPRS